MEEREHRLRLIQRLSAEERSWQPDPRDWLKEHDMADDKSKVGGQDRKRININEPWELDWWSKELGLTKDQLRAAVRKFGSAADKVRDELKKKQQTGLS